MKTYTRLFLLLSIVLSLIAAPGIVRAQGGTTYTDPQGRFNADIPAGWTDQSTDQYGLFTNADKVQVYLLAVEGTEVQAGIQAALAITSPDLVSVTPQSNELPLPNGTWTQNIYLGTSAALDVALGYAADGTVYVLIMRIPDQNLMAGTLQGDLNSILLSFTIGQKIDLSGAKALTFTPEMLAELDQYIAAEFEKSGIPGASIAIVQDGQVIYTRGLGVREVGSDAAVTDQTLFMIGSTTKSMTTMITATLVDDGILDWNKPVIEILPSFALSDPEATPEIRVRDLFNMSTGVPRYDEMVLIQRPTPEELIASLAQIPMVAKPGEQFNYSNQMVASGGYIVALAAGGQYGVNLYDTYKELLQTRVFDRIGMTSSTIDFDQVTANENHAQPHTNDLLTGGVIVVPLDFERPVIPESPAGAVWSNAQDMAKYMITELNRGAAPDGKRVVSEENLLITQSPEIEIASGISYGMGWMIEDSHGQKMIEHGGGTSGFNCDFSFLPDAGLGVVVLMNRTDGTSFSTAVRTYVYEMAFGLEHRYQPSYTTTIDALRQQVTVSVPDPASVQDFLGHYELDLTAAVSDSGEFTIASIYGAIPLLAVGQPGVFMTGGGVPGMVVTFAPNAQGVMTITFSSELNGSGGLTLARVETP